MMRRAVALLVATCAIVAAAGCSDDPEPVAGTTIVRAGDVAFNAVVREPAGDDGKALTVLFLHGGSYTSRIWADRDILDRVSAAGHRAVAVDLPGSGGTDATDEPEAEVLAALVGELAPAGRVILVSPSASGRYSLALLAEATEVDLAGFVAVAPVGIDGFTAGPSANDLPALLIWGENDDVIPVSQAETLGAQLSGSEFVVIPDGSHAPYDDHPEEFSDVLLGFLSEERVNGGR